MQQTSHGPPLKACRVDAAATVRTQVAPRPGYRPQAQADADDLRSRTLAIHPFAPCAGIASRAAMASTAKARASLEFHHHDRQYLPRGRSGRRRRRFARWWRARADLDHQEAGNRRLPFDAERLQRSIDAVHAEFPQLDVSDYRRVVQAMVERKPSISADDLVDLLIREAESRVDLVAPEWEQFAARIYLRRLYKRASRNRFYDVSLKYGSYVGLQESLADRGIYSNDILRCYSKEELQQAGEMIDPERDRLFAYNGLYLLATRYLASDRSREVMSCRRSAG